MVLAMYPRPAIEFDERAAALPERHDIEKQLNDALQEPFVLEPLGVQVSLVDFISIVMSLDDWLRTRGRALLGSSTKPALYSRVADVLAEAYDGNKDRFRWEITNQVGKVMFEHSRVDRHILLSGFEAKPPPTGGKVGLVVLVSVIPAQTVVCEVGGEKRRVYRCGGPAGEGGYIWNEVNRSLLQGGGDAFIPVYAQSHALRKLHSRLAVLGDRWPANHCLFASLMAPAISRQRNRTYLIEARLLGHKIGYFVAEDLENKMLVKTFLLATMAGTPEADLLRRRLTMVRRDIEEMALDRLDTFLTSDLRDDPEVVDVLRQCGMGHLFDLASIAKRTGPAILGRAADLRRYLGLQDAHQ